MVGIVLVTAFGFITLLFTVISLVITYQHDNAESFMDYKNELRLQNDKIDALTSAIKNQKAAPQPETTPAQQ